MLQTMSPAFPRATVAAAFALSSPPGDPCGEAADAVLLAAGCAPADEHTILRENVATLLTQMRPDFVESLPRALREKGTEALIGAYEAASNVGYALKLSRDTRMKPYADVEVFDHLHDLEGELKTEMRRIIEGSNGYPCKFYIAGSLLKGRFGAGSDLDVLCDAPTEWARSQRLGAENGVSVQYMDGLSDADKHDFVAAFGRTQAVTEADVERPGLLTDLFSESAARKGFVVSDGHLQQRAPVILREVETPPEEAKRIGWGFPMV